MPFCQNLGGSMAIFTKTEMVPKDTLWSWQARYWKEKKWRDSFNKTDDNNLPCFRLQYSKLPINTFSKFSIKFLWQQLWWYSHHWTFCRSFYGLHFICQRYYWSIFFWFILHCWISEDILNYVPLYPPWLRLN